MIPDYEIVDPLAPMGGAERSIARRTSTGETVVLRVLRPELVSSPLEVARFIDTVCAAQGLSHPHLARVLDSGLTAEGVPWVTTEYFEGEDLAQHLKNNPGLSPAELIRLAVPMCEALHTGHAAGVLHGGIKPSSIFIARGLGHDASRLLDLGLCRFTDDLAVGGAREAQVALLMYAAPETIGGAAADVRSEIYSLGVVLFEALTGAPPFVASTPAQLRTLQLEKSPRRLTGSHAPLASVVERCLAKNPIDRYPSAQALADALRACRLPATLNPEDVGPQASEPEPDADPAREKLGDVLGVYQLTRLLGEGSMGRVYLAQHTKLGRQVALKVLRDAQTRHRTLVQRFFQEARTVNQINHEHIVEVFDFIEEPRADGSTLVYCVMELLSGLSLSALLAKERLPVVRCVAITRQICDALGAAHRVGVVHRDIKPDNVFLTTRAGQRDFVKVLDFGVAKVALQPGLKTTVSDTASGALVGTPTYMAPEQAAGLEVDSRADIYAVATVLYEMLAGHPPFQSTTFGQLAAEIITRDPPPLGNLSISEQRIATGLKTELIKALEKAPDARHPTMEAFSAALAPYAADLRASSASGMGRAAAMVAGVVALGAVGWALWPRAAPESRVVFPASPPVAPSPVALPQTVTLTVASSPPGAHVVRRDTQAELGLTPLTVQLPRASNAIELGVQLEGHLPEVRSVRLDANTAIDVALVKQPAPARPARPAVRPKKSIGKESTIDPFSE